MTYSREQAISMAQNKIDGFKAALNLLNLVPEFEQARYYISDGNVSVILPYNWQTYKQFRRLLGKNWKVGMDKWTQCQHEERMITYHLNFLHRSDPAKHYFMTKMGYLSVELRTGMVGATCKMVKTGEKIVPILEVECGG